MNAEPCTICGRSREELELLGTCLVDVVPRYPEVPVQVVCLPCLNAAVWFQREAVQAIQAAQQSDGAVAPGRQRR